MPWCLSQEGDLHRSEAARISIFKRILLLSECLCPLKIPNLKPDPRRWH